MSLRPGNSTCVTDMDSVRVPRKLGRVSRSVRVVTDVPDLVFSQSKVPLASWVTLGRENEVKAASSGSKTATIESAMA